MPKNVSAVRLNKPHAQSRNAAPKEPPSAMLKYMEESSPMRLDEVKGYFKSRLPKEFRVSEGVYSPRGREGVAKGDIIIICLEKSYSTLKLKPSVSPPVGNDVTIPVSITQTEFALTPPSEEDNETDAAIRSWEGEFHSVAEFFEARRDQSTPMPAALMVLDHAVDHKGQKVPAGTILFNIHKLTQWVRLRKRRGIEGVDCSGTVHQFLEGEDPLYFSTKLIDVKCIPFYFANVLQVPQTARVYHTEEGEEGDLNSLQNLSTINITEVSKGQHLVMRKLSDSGDGLGPVFTVPLDADLKVVAIKLKDSHLLDSIPDQRYFVTGIKSSGLSPSEPDDTPNHYYEDPCKTRAAVQAEMKCCRCKEAYYNADTLRLKRHHGYVNVKVAVAFVPRHASTDNTCTASDRSDQDHACTGDRESVDNSNVYEYMQGTCSKMTSPVTLHSKTLPPYHGNPAKPLAVPCKHWKNQTESSVASSGSTVMSARKGNNCHSPCSDTQKLQFIQGRDKDEPQDACAVAFEVGSPTQGQLKGSPSPLGEHVKPKQHSSFPSQPPPVLPCPQKDASNDEETCESMFVEVKSPKHQRIKSDWKQSQTSRSPIPVTPAHSGHSPKPKPKGVPSTAIPLTPFPSTCAPQLLQVRKKARILTSCPNEPELRFHVAAKLGQSWRRVCCALGLQHYQLDQADEAHAKLEEKAMEALVMWLQGQGESRAPRSWSTLVEALRQAERNDIASDLEI